MAENKVPSEKQPGEKREGTFHFNPGNMAGKAAKIGELSREGESQPNETTKRADEAAESGGGLAKTYRELAQRVRRDAEGAAASDRSR